MVRGRTRESDAITHILKYVERLGGRSNHSIANHLWEEIGDTDHWKWHTGKPGQASEIVTTW